MDIPVIYEDDWLLVVDKPPGLLVVPTPKNERVTLTNILNEDLKRKGETFRLHPCHRLDRETSGLIIYAKGKSSQKKMMNEFKSRKIKKTYIAFIQGALTKNKGQIDFPIEGLRSVTNYQVIERRRGFTIVRVKPQTGRTNQIRIHFKDIGHPLVGETRFAYRRDYSLRAKRACLHSESLEFMHPVTGKNIKIYLELSRDLKEFLKTHN